MTTVLDRDRTTVSTQLPFFSCWNSEPPAEARDARLLHRRIVRFFNLNVESGLMIVNMEPNSPAARAGVLEGDVVIAFDGLPVSGSAESRRSGGGAGEIDRAPVELDVVPGSGGELDACVSTG